jgi:hydrogenase nickel incorporation protein HypB
MSKKPYQENEIATRNREVLAKTGTLMVCLNGGPGCGKSTLIDSTVRRLAPAMQCGVICCDISARLEGNDGSGRNGQTVYVKTGARHAPTPQQISHAMHCLDLKTIGILFIENVSTLDGQAPLDLGQHLNAAMFSVAATHDGAEAHQELIQSADAVILNKLDVLHAVPFNLHEFRAAIRRMKPQAELLELSLLKEHGHEDWLRWLQARSQAHKASAQRPAR